LRKKKRRKSYLCDMKLKLTELEKAELKKLQHHAGEKSVYVKVTVLLMLDKGRSIPEVAEDLGLDDSTIYRYFNLYTKEGLDKYLFAEYKGYLGRMTSEQLEELRQELKDRLYTDSKEIVRWVSEKWGIQYTPPGMIALLHRMGFSYKQTKQVPCEANREKQKAFIETLETLLETAEKENAVIYFADGVHPTHNTRSSTAWIETGTEREQLSVSGRDRVNINGAVNAQNPVEVLFVESESVNAQSTQALYEKIIAQNPNKSKIYVIGDNARYYKNKFLKEWLDDKPIEQIFLPPYSPNLNVIERLWKFMRKKVINTSFYRTKEAFRASIHDFFNHISNYKEELVTLLTLKFHLFDSQSIL
jgi:transposase